MGINKLEHILFFPKERKQGDGKLKEILKEIEKEKEDGNYRMF